ncbi:hypothetical protein ACFWNN_30780 [Lentzea sp. NPDC058450]|uniref:hypothetical protein n=1 Tax=Lentzea sp. NPDC058450 TaxID=3346505 RepID=UPI00365C505C
MLLAEFVERAADTGLAFMIKMDGPRPSNKWTMRINKSPFVGDYWMGGGDYQTLDKLLASARRSLAELPGDWSWTGEPISDAEAYAELFEAIGETGELFIVQYSLNSKWVLFAAGDKIEGFPTLDACVLNGLSKLGW